MGRGYGGGLVTCFVFLYQELYIEGQITLHAAIHQGDLISVGIPSLYPASRIFMTFILSLSLAPTADSRAYLR